MKNWIIAGSMLLLISCNDSPDFDPELDKQVSKPTDAATAVTPPDMSLPTPIGNPNPAPANTVPATAGNTGGGAVNPPHGQPGHRCDIAVGAPLNSAPATTTTTTTTTTAAPAQTTPQNITLMPKPAQAAPVKTAPGMNPPHGEPGHRCDIAVGAPLNSAPANGNAETAKPGTETRTDSSGNQ